MRLKDREAFGESGPLLTSRGGAWACSRGRGLQEAAGTFSKDLDLTVAVARLREILANVVAEFEALRKERLRLAPLDESKMDFVRRAITESVLVYGPTIACFRGFSIRRDDSGEIPVTETEFGVIDKGSLVVTRCHRLISKSYHLSLLRLARTI